MATDTITIGALELAGEGDIVADFAIDGAGAVQGSALLGVKDAVPLNRFARQRTITFTVTRAPAESVTAARAAMFDHEIAISALGAPVSATFVMDAGGGSITRVLANAVVQSSRASMSGRTIRHAYTLVGGALSVVEPEPEP